MAHLANLGALIEGSLESFRSGNKNEDELKFCFNWREICGKIYQIFSYKLYLSSSLLYLSGLLCWYHLFVIAFLVSKNYIYDDDDDDDNDNDNNNNNNNNK